MIYLVFVLFLLAGLGLIGFGMLLLWKRKDREMGTVKFKLPFASFQFSGAGAGGIVCILLGAVCLYLVLDVAVNAGREKEHASALALVRVAVAQQNPSQTGDAQTKGWVYAPKGSFTGDEIKEAQRRAPLRANHFDDLTGTFLGKLLGHAEPEVVGHIEPGDCVAVRTRAVVGFRKTWMEVTKVPCPTNSDH